MKKPMSFLATKNKKTQSKTRKMKIVTLLCGLVALTAMSAQAQAANGLERATTCQVASDVTFEGILVESAKITWSGMKVIDGIANPKCAEKAERLVKRLCRRNNRGDKMADQYGLIWAFKAAEVDGAVNGGSHPLDAFVNQYTMTTLDANWISGQCTDFVTN